MKTLLALALAAVICAPGAASPWRRGVQTDAAAPSWETYAHPDEEFSVAMPHTPIPYDTVRMLKGRPTENAKARAFAVYADGVVYLIWSYDKPQAGEDVAHFARYFSYYKLSRDVKVYERGEVRRGNFAGMRYAIIDKRFPDGDNEFSFHVYRARRHAYVVAAYGAGEGNAAVRRFFESFDLSDSRARPRTTAAAAAPPPSGGQLQPRAKGEGTDAKPAGIGEGSSPAAAGGDAPVDYTGVFKPSEVTRKAIPVFRPEPLYTEEARKNQITGTVTLRMAFNANGTITNIVSIGRLPHGLTERAVAAARQIKFIPAEKDGRRVSHWATVQYNFNIY